MASDSRRWSPFHEIDQFKKDFDGVLDRFLGGPGGRRASDAHPLPLIESYIEDGMLTIRADLPGVDPKDIEVVAAGDQLTIRGKREGTTEERERDFLLRELYYGHFGRVVKLPGGANPDETTARHRNGVLELSLPLVNKVAVRKVPINLDPKA